MADPLVPHSSLSVGDIAPVKNYQPAPDPQNAYSNIFNNVMQQVKGQPSPVWTDTRYTPWDEASRYMSGLGHSGYTGPSSSEDYNAKNESWATQGLNGILKGVAIAGTSFIDGTAGLLTGASEAIYNKDFSRLFNNEVSNAMQGIRDDTEKSLPNYYTDKEQAAPLWSPDYWAHMNFLSDKIIKNLGWAAAAMGESFAVGKLAGSLARKVVFNAADDIVKDLEASVSALQNGSVKPADAGSFLRNKLSGYLSKPVDGMGTLGSIQANYGDLYENVNKGIERFSNVLATTTEANSEALQGYTDIKKDLVQQYKDAHYDQEPDDKTMADIEARAKQGSTMRFWANVGLLSVTNNIEFPRLMNGALKFEKSTLGRQTQDIIAEGIQGTEGVNREVARTGETYAAKQVGKSGKIAKAIWDAGGVVANTEALEEGLQYAVETGTHDYEMRTKDPNAIAAVAAIFSEGLPKMLSTREGWENMLIGGLSGKLMARVLEGSDHTKQHTNELLKGLNDGPQAGAFVSGYDAKQGSFSSALNSSVIRGVSLLTDKKEAVEKGDTFKALNLEADFIHNYVLPRVQYGRFDLLTNELLQYKQRPIEEVREELGLPDDTTAETVSARVDGLLQKATMIKDLYGKMSMGYGLQHETKDGKQVQKYSAADIERMSYLAYKVWDTEHHSRKLADDLEQALSSVNSPLTVNALFDKGQRKKAGTEEHYDLEEVRNELSKQINKVRPELYTDNEGIGLDEKLRDVERLQNQREALLQSFENIKEQRNPLMDFDLHVADVPQYRQYEQAQARLHTMQALERNTELRPFVNEIERKLKDGKEKGTDLVQLLSSLRTKNAFVWQHLRPQMAAIIHNELEQHNRNTTALQSLHTEQQRMEELINKHLDHKTGMPWGEPLSDDEATELAQLEAGEQERNKRISESEATNEKEPVNTDALIKMREALGAGLEHVAAEPTELSAAERSRKVADSFIAPYHEINDNVRRLAGFDKEGKLTDIGEYGDEKTLSEIDGLSHNINSLQRIFSDRKDISLKKGPFKNYLEELAGKKKFLEEVKDAIEKRLGDREAIQKKSEATYVAGLGLGIGYNIHTNEISDRNLYDMVRDHIGVAGFDPLMDKIRKEKRMELVHELYDLLKDSLSGQELKETLQKLDEEKNKLLSAQTALVDKIASHELNRSSPLSNNYTLNPELFFSRLMLHLAGNEELSQVSAYKNYSWHKNHLQLWQDSAEEISSGKSSGFTDYEKVISKEERLQLLQNQAALTGITNLQQSLRSDKTYSDIYAKLRLLVADANKKAENVPTTQQLISVIEAVNFYFFANDTGTFQNWAYLEGVIGAGKTSIFTKYVLKCIAEITGRDVSDIVHATADTVEATDTINQTLKLDGKDNIAATIQALDNNAFNKELIIIDEAARPSAEQLAEMAKAVQEYNSRNEKNIKVLAIGDTNQIIDASVPGIEKSEGLSSLMPFSISYRSNVAAIADVQAIYKSAGAKKIDKLTSSGTVSSIQEGAGSPVYGVFGSKNEEDMIAALQTRPLSIDGRPLTKALIVNKGQEGYWNSRLKDIAQLQVINYYNAQGKTFDEVYLWLKEDPHDHLLKNQADVNNVIYTNLRGRNLAFLGNTEVNTIAKPSVQEGIDRNINQNMERGRQLYDKLDNAVKEFETLAPEVPQAPNAADESKVADNDRIGQQMLQRSTEDTNELLENGITGEPQISDDNDTDNNSPEIENELLLQAQPEDKVDEQGNSLPVMPEPVTSAAIHELAHPSSDNLKADKLNGNKIMILALPDNNSGLKFSVVQPAGEQGQFRELAVIGKENGELQKLSLAEGYNTINKKFTNNSNFRENALKSFKDKRSGTIEVKPVNGQSLVDFLKQHIITEGSIINAAPLSYNYDHNPAVKDTVFNNANKLLDYIKDRVSKVFNTDDHVNPPQGPVIMGTEKHVKEYSNGKGKMPLLQKSKPHIVIKLAKGRYQAIELAGRVLNYTQPLHYTIYGDPIVSFFDWVKAFDQLAGLDNFFAANPDLLSEAGLQVSDFQTGGKHWNKLITLLADGEYKHALSDKKAVTVQQAALYKSIIEHLEGSGSIDRLLELASEMDRLAYKRAYEKQYVLKDSDGNIIDTLTTAADANKLKAAHEGSTVQEEPITYTDDFGKVKVRQKNREMSGPAQLALEHLMKANPVIKTVGKTLFPVFTRSWKEGDKTINQFRVRNILHHKLNGPEIGTQHRAFLENYILGKSGIAKEMGFSSKVNSYALDGLRRKLSAIHKSLNEFGNVAAQDFGSILFSLQESYTNNGANLLKNLFAQASLEETAHDKIDAYLDLLNHPYDRQDDPGKFEALQHDMLLQLSALFDNDTRNIKRYYDYWQQLEQQRGNYKTQLSHDDIRSLLHPDDAINENGESKLGLRINVPLMWQFLSKPNFAQISYNPSTKTSTQELVHLSQEDQLHQMLTTRLTAINPAQLSVTLDPAAQETVKPDENKQQRPTRKQTGRQQHIPDDLDFAPLQKNKLSNYTLARTIFHGEALAYIRRFLPNIKAADLQVLDRLQLLRQFGKELYGAFMDGVIYLEKNDQGDVYAEAIRHEVFHAIFRQYLSVPERAALLSAARLQYNMPAAPANEVEEKLAAVFQQRKDHGLLRPLVNFFQHIGRLFRFLSGRKDIITDLFDKIDRGNFKRLSTEPAISMGFATLAKVQKAFDNDPFVIRRAKDYLQQQFATFSYLSQNDLDPHTDWEIKDEIIQDLRVLKATHEARLNNFRALDPAQRDEVLAKWNKLAAKEQYAIIQDWDNGTDHPLYDQVWTTDDQHTLAAVNGLLQIKDGQYYVLNELIKGLKPEIKASALESNEELEEEPETANLQSLFEKDDSIDIRSKMTGDLKMFLSSIFRYGKNGIPQFVRMEQALYYVYENISGLNGGSAADFKHNLQTVFERSGISSWQKQLTLKSLLKIADMASTTSNLYRLTYTGADGIPAIVGINDNAGFVSENRFQYKGGYIDRTASGKKQTTPDFFDKIIDTLKQNADKGEQLFRNSDKLTVDDFSNEHLHLLLKSYWQRDMSNRVLQDLVNLADSLYFTNPYTGVYKRQGGNTTYDTFSLQPDKDKPLMKSNLLDALWQKVLKADTKELEQIKQRIEERKQDAGGVSEPFDAILTDFLDVLGILSRDNNKGAMADPGNVHLENAIYQVCSSAPSLNNEEAFNNYVRNAQGYINAIARAASYNSQAEKTITSYIRSDGKKQFFQRYMAFANKVILKILRHTADVREGKWKVQLDTYLNTPFFKHNIFNPIGHYTGPGSINSLIDYSLDDAVSEDGVPSSAVLYDRQSPKDYLTRVFLVHFGAMINANRSKGKQLSYRQNFYTVSDKSTNTNAEVYMLGYRHSPDENSKGSSATIGNAIWAAIKQELERPDAATLHLKNYSEKDRQNTLLPGLEQAEAQMLREQLRKRIQGAETVQANDPLAAQLTEMVFDALEKDADHTLSVIIRMNEQAVYNDTSISADKAIVFDTDMAAQYEKLLNHKLLRPADLDKEHFTVRESNHEFHVTMNGYSPNLWNWNVSKEHISPMWRLFYANNYINGLFLNQLVAGDQAMFKHSIDQVKRMAGPFAVGMSPLQIDAQEQNEKWPNARRMNKSYRVAVTPDLYLIRRASGDTEYIFRTAKEARKLLQPGDELINATDAAGIMSKRRYEQTRKGFGPGLQLQANQKPVHWEIGKDGVPRYLKYASFVLSDELCKKFPQYLGLRIQMETHGMAPAAAKEAGDLLTEQVQKGLSPAQRQRLETLFKTNEDKYIDEMIHESGVKTGLPATLARFDEEKEQFSFDQQSTLELSNENWRIQLNPSAAVDSHVSLFTQLLYYAGFDKTNLVASTEIYSSLASWFDLRLHKVLQDLGVKDLPALADAGHEKIASAVKGMILDRIAHTPGKERLWEYLNEGLSLDTPFIANDVSTQLSSLFNKSVIQVKFPGSKFQLLSPEMTNHFEGKQNAMPKYDPLSNTMEVYLPDIWKNYLPDDMRSLDNESIKELNLMLGFRIPSTGLNSSARIKVIGFWPSEQNVVVAPADINRQMGSDYDVDSLFLAHPEILSDAERGYIRRIGIADHQAAGFAGHERIDNMEAILEKYKGEGQARQVLEKVYANRIIYAYLDMLSQEHNLEDIQRPTDFDLLKSPDGIFTYVAASINKQFADKLDTLKEDTDPIALEKEREQILAPKEDINNIWNNMKMYLANRSGKALVGITANAAKTFAYLAYQGHVQSKPVLYNKPFTYNGHVFDRIGYNTDEHSMSLYNQDGKKLSEVFSILINAAVDNAKEQILSVINLTTANANAFLTLAGSGLSLKSVVTLMRQPLIRDLSELNRINSYAISDKRNFLMDKLGLAADNTTNTELNDELIRGYMQYDSMDNAAQHLKGTALTEFYRHQLAVLKLFEKAQDIGQAVFSMSRALGILQNNQPTVEDMQDVMDEIFRLYRMKEEMTPDSKGGYFKFKTYQIDDTHKDMEGIFRTDFPLKNVDLLQIPHWASAFRQLQALYQVNKKALFRNSDLIQRLSQNLEKSFDLRLDRSPNKNRALIRTEMVKAVLSGLHFSYQGKQIDFSTLKQAPYIVKDNKGNPAKIYYRNDAFIQSFIQKVRSYKNAYPDNPFLRLLRIDNDWQSGLAKLSVKDISGIVKEYEELKIIENGFKSLDSQERSKYEGVYAEHWYSDFQFDFVKYLALTQGLRFGSFSYAWLLPADIYARAIKGLDDSFQDMRDTALQYIKTTAQYEAANGKEKNEMEAEAKTESGSYNILKDHISDFLALQIAKNNASELSKLNYGRTEITASLKLRADKEGNFYNLLVKPSLKEKNIAKFSPTSDEQKDETAGESPKENAVAFYDRMPAIIRHTFLTGPEHKPSKTTYVLARTGQDSEGNALYQVIGKASNNASYQFDKGLLAPAMHGYYTVGKFLNSKTYYTAEDNISDQDGHPILSVPAALKPEQSVMSLKKSDDLRLESGRYRIVEELKKGSILAQSMGKKLAELISERNNLPVTEQEVATLQRKVDRLAEQLRRNTTDKLEQEFTSAQKEYERKSGMLANKLQLQQQIEELQQQRKQEMYLYRLEKIADGFSPEETNITASDIGISPGDIEKGTDDTVSCLPSL